MRRFLDGVPFYFLFLFFCGCKSVLFKACTPLLLGVLPLLVWYMQRCTPHPLPWRTADSVHVVCCDWCFIFYDLDLRIFMVFSEHMCKSVMMILLIWRYVHAPTDSFFVVTGTRQSIHGEGDGDIGNHGSQEDPHGHWARGLPYHGPSRRLKSSRSCTTRTSAISKRLSSPGPERDEQGKQSMILSKNTIDCFALLLIQMCHMLWCWVVKGNKYKGSICL